VGELSRADMRTLACILALALVGGSTAQFRRGQRLRSGRQDTGYAAPPPADDYAQPAYGDDQDVYQGAASDAIASDDNIAMLEKAVPGVPGEDYPIYAEVPESGFSCEGQVDGGYYADPEAECQVFHICTADGAGGLSQYSFLCPNGTVFNQNYFICDWWFNVDCAESAALAEAKNAEVAAAAAAASEAAASDAVESYAAPAAAEYDYEEAAEAASDVAGGYLAPADAEYEEYEEQAAYGGAPTYSGRL